MRAVLAVILFAGPAAAQIRVVPTAGSPVSPRLAGAAVSAPAALSFDAEPSFKILGDWNNPGHKAWFEDSYRCFAYWQASGTACAVCLAVCPFTKAAHAWVRQVVKATVSLTPATDGLFRAIDDAAECETRRDPERWWIEDPPPASRQA